MFFIAWSLVLAVILLGEGESFFDFAEGSGCVIFSGCTVQSTDFQY